MADTGFWAVITLGFLLGIKHALDADHVVAVSTIASQNRSILRSLLVGVFWGIGHTTTLLVVGIAVLVFRITIPPHLALLAEFAVGVVLVFLGISVLRSLWINRIHLHPHTHDETSHLHLHGHRATSAHAHEHGLRQGRRPLIVGMFHGLAGSAALMLLVLTTIDSAFWGLLYIVIFGVGSILGMLLISGAIGLPFVLTAGRFRRANELIQGTAGVISIALGLFIMGEIAFFQGLWGG